MTRSERVAAVCACLVGGAGLVVMGGWALHIRSFVQWVPETTPMQFNTAALFVVGGLGVLAMLRQQPGLARASGAFLFLVALATLGQYVLDANLGIDQLIVLSFIPEVTPHPVRMAPNSAVGFLLLGAALMLGRGASVVVLSAVAWGLALVAGLGYLTDIDTYGWGQHTRMAPHTSAVFLLFSTAVLALAWDADDESGLPPWLPVTVAVVALSVTAFLWQGLLLTSPGPLPAMVLLSGTGGALLLAVVTRLWRTNALQATRLQSAIAELQEEVGRRTRLQEELQALNRDLDQEVQRRSHLAEERRLEAEAANRQLDERVVELARSNAELEQFAYVASHDLQEPLRALAGFSGLLLRRYGDVLDDRGKDYAGRMVAASVRLQEQIEDLLSYSRVTTRGEELRPTSSALAVATALDNLRAAREETGAQVEIGEMPEVYADPAQLVQVFQNLVGNALKFRREGPPHVRISGWATPEGVVFTVQDDGIGIEPQYFDRIFHLFQRLHTREQYAGTGIGLALCKKVVDRHRGRLWVESQPGAGSAFHFLLPHPAQEAP